MKKIDAHAHIGYIGGWADVGITGEELVATGLKLKKQSFAVRIMTQSSI